MTDKEEKEVQNAYTLNADGNMELTGEGEKRESHWTRSWEEPCS